MRAISTKAVSTVGGGYADSPGYIDKDEYEMIKDAWREHARMVRAGYSHDRLCQQRDLALAMHAAATQF
jgi:hypothetical protein